MQHGAGRNNGVAKHEIALRFVRTCPSTVTDDRGINDGLRSLRAIERGDGDVSEASLRDKKARDADG
jgi:hypothetical protein